MRTQRCKCLQEQGRLYRLLLSGGMRVLALLDVVNAEPGVVFLGPNHQIPCHAWVCARRGDCTTKGCSQGDVLKTIEDHESR